MVANGTGQSHVDRNSGFSVIVNALARAQKSNRGAPGYSRWVNRPIGRIFAAAAFKIGLAPNHVTAVSAVFTFAGIVALASGRPSLWWGILVCVLLIIGYALDSADGQLARLRGGGSLAGEWLDHVVDSVKCASIHLAVLILWYRALDAPEWTLIIPIVFTVESCVWFFTILLTEMMVRAARSGSEFGTQTASAPQKAPLLRSLAALPADYGLLCVLFWLIGLPTAFCIVYGIIAALNVLILARQLPVWYRRVAALGR